MIIATQNVFYNYCYKEIVNNLNKPILKTNHNFDSTKMLTYYKNRTFKKLNKLNKDC